MVRAKGQSGREQAGAESSVARAQSVELKSSSGSKLRHVSARSLCVSKCMHECVYKCACV